MKSAVGTYYSSDGSEAARKLKEVWNSAALNKSTTSKEISFHPVRYYDYYDYYVLRISAFTSFESSSNKSSWTQ